jgi:tRNA isopentenyl-2-thiomethyl-A-37 hydroxylase MiaE
MKITKQQLKRIIKEEIEEISEAYEPDPRLTRGLEKSMAAGEADRTPEEVMREEVQALADKFNVEAFVEVASDGNTAILVFHQDGEPTAYNDTEEMYKDLADEIGRDIHGDPDRYEDEY